MLSNFRSSERVLSKTGFLTKSLNASEPSEHPPDRGEKDQNV